MSEPSSRIEKTIKNTLFSFSNQMLSVILSFILRTVFIKILGTQYTGVSSVFATLLTVLSLSELGFSTAIATALYAPLKNKNNMLIQQLMDFYKKSYRIIALCVFILGVAFVPFLKIIIKEIPDIKENIILIYVLYLLKTSVSYLMIYKSTLLNADQKIYIVKKSEMICQLVRYIIEIVILIIFRDFLFYLFIEVLATIIQNYYITKKAEKYYPYAFIKPSNKLSKNVKYSLFKDIKGLSMFKLSGIIGNSIDTMLISSFINTSTVAIVGNYTLIKDNIYKLLMQFFSAVIPSIGNLVVEEKKDKQEIIFNRLMYVSFLMANFCSVSMFILFTPFITIWLGESFLLSHPIAFVISLDFFLYILLEAIASFRTANGLFIKGQYRPLITAIINVFLSVILIKRYGVFGTIVATIISRLITQWYDPFLLYRNVFGNNCLKFFIKYYYYLCIFMISLLFTYFVYQILSFSNLYISVISAIFICIIIPNICAILMTIKTNEFKYVFDITVKLIKKLYKHNFLR